MAVSANTLFHFTDRKETLLSILREGFKPSYSVEDLSSILPTGPIEEVYVPMVCFCDIPLSQISDHMGFYGEYGIGLRKKPWGLDQKITPVLYAAERSRTTELIRQVVLSVAELKLSPNEDLRQGLLAFCKYVKSYEGRTWNKRSKEMVDRLFYNEREWRYSPPNVHALINPKDNQGRLEKEKEQLRNSAPLTFRATDVKYVIVPSEREAIRFKLALQRLHGLSPKTRKALVAKVIGADQIREDM